MLLETSTSPVTPANRIYIVPTALQSLDTTRVGVGRIFRGIVSFRVITSVVASYVAVRRAREKEGMGKV
jgi:ABC-type branched-subunit amino acid transport system substrate-binding protein